MSEFDPITTAIVRGRLTGAVDIAARTLVRTAFSAVVSDMLDFTCLLLDSSCEVIAQATRSQPPFLGTGPWTAREMLRRYPAGSLRKGDLLITNDPWIGTGHLNDFTAMSPIYVGGHLAAYALTAAHVPSIGGRVYGADSRDVFEEGLRVPISKLYRGGRRNLELFDLIRVNCRTPVETLGDLEAYRAANLTMERGVLDIAEDVGDRMHALFGHIKTLTAAAVRHSIGQVEDGIYEASLVADGFDKPMTLAIEIDVRGDSLAVRYSAPVQAPWGINCPFTYTRSLTFFALKCCLAPDVPNNHGAFEPFSVDAPPGSVLNATFPAAVAGRGKIGHYIPNLVMRALADALPDAITADTGNPHASLTFAFQSGRTTSEALFFIPGGFGARATRDGLNCTYFPANCSTPSVEVFEAELPVLVEEQRLAIDSGGAGRQRGGMGMSVRFRNASQDHLSFSPQIDHMAEAAAGAHMGGAGALAAYRTSFDPHPHPKARTDVPPNHTIEVQTAGGGGYGDPHERPRSMVQADIRNELISAEAASVAYGLAQSHQVREPAGAEG